MMGVRFLLGVLKFLKFLFDDVVLIIGLFKNYSKKKILKVLWDIVYDGCEISFGCPEVFEVLLLSRLR